jgi:hypothetical protein
MAKILVPSSSNKTTTYQMILADDTITVNGSGGGFTVTLPDATLVIPGKNYSVIRTDNTLANVVTLATLSSQTIGTTTTKTLNTQDEGWVVASDGANWQIKAHKYDSSWVDSGSLSISATSGTTPTLSGSFTVNKVKWKREGKDAVINYAYAATATGTAGSAGTILIALPANLTIDTTLITLFSTALTQATVISPSNSVGTGFAGYASDNGAAALFVFDSTHIRLYFETSSQGSIFCFNSNLNPAASNLQLNFEIRVPISGWSD